MLQSLSTIILRSQMRCSMRRKGVPSFIRKDVSFVPELNISLILQLQMIKTFMKRPLQINLERLLKSRRAVGVFSRLKLPPLMSHKMRTRFTIERWLPKIFKLLRRRSKESAKDVRQLIALNNSLPISSQKPVRCRSERADWVRGK